MKAVVLLIKNYVQADFEWKRYLYTALFLTVCIALNYTYNFEDGVLDSYYGTVWCIVFYALFYIFAFSGIYFPQLLFWKKQVKFSWKGLFLAFWISLILGINAGFYWYDSWIQNLHLDRYDPYYVRLLANNLSPFILTQIMVLLYVLVTRDRLSSGSYFTKTNFKKIRPYLLMLLVMFPLIFWASFQPDFQSQYPVYKFWKFPDVLGLSDTWSLLIYEICYGIDFINTEYVFRGLLVIGVARFIGKDALLPMVAVYAFLHFGKPLGETIGSIFGGYILGILALESKNIWGGILAHLGVAFLMDFTAIYQHLN